MKQYWANAEDKTRMYVLELIDHEWSISRVGNEDNTGDDYHITHFPTPKMQTGIHNTMMGKLRWLKRLVINGVLIKLTPEEAKKKLMLMELSR